MTAEVAVLNKSAVALAADSAVTISIGEKEEKTFDSADKLFELCSRNPIGVMVYNGLSFVEIPLQTIIKQFRGGAENFEYVKDAAFSLLKYLNSIGEDSPRSRSQRCGSIHNQASLERRPRQILRKRKPNTFRREDAKSWRHG